MSGYDPSVTKEAFNDPGTIMMLLGSAMPNIYRGTPGQGGYALKPGQVLSTLGDTYSTIKNRQEALGGIQDFANQASMGSKFAAFGGQDPEGVAWAGGGSPVEQAQNLAAYHPQTLGSYIANASKERLRGIFANTRGGTPLEQALGLPAGQTPFERVAKEVQTGEESKLAQARRQSYGELMSESTKDPFDPELRKAVMSLAPPTTLEALTEKYQKLDSRTAELQDKRHGERALPLDLAKRAVLSGQDVPLLAHMNAATENRVLAEAQKKALAPENTPNMDANARAAIVGVIDKTGMPWDHATLQKIITDPAKQQSINDVLNDPKLAELRSLTDPTRMPLSMERFTQILSDPRFTQNPEMANYFRNLYYNHVKDYRNVEIQKQMRDDQREMMQMTHDQTAQGTLIARQAKLANEISSILSIAPRNPDGSLKPEFAKTPQYQQYQILLREQKQAEQEERRLGISIHLKWNPQGLIVRDAREIQGEVDRIVARPDLTPEQKLKELDNLPRKVMDLQQEYGDAADAAMVKKGQLTKEQLAEGGWRAQVPKWTAEKVEEAKGQIERNIWAQGLQQAPPQTTITGGNRFFPEWTTQPMTLPPWLRGSDQPSPLRQYLPPPFK